MNKEVVLSTETIFDGRIFRVERKQIDLNGKKSNRELVYHPGGSCVLAVDEEMNIYLVKQYRIAVDDFLYELPAGKLEAYENPRECAIRELREECGVLSKSFKEFAIMHPTPGYCSEKIYIYLAQDLQIVEQDLDEGEELELIKIPFKQAYQWLEEGKIIDAKTMLALYKAKIYFGM